MVGGGRVGSSFGKISSTFFRCIEAGLVKVNGNSVTLDYKIGNNDFISHKGKALSRTFSNSIVCGIQIV